MHDSFVCLVILINEENRPISCQRILVDSEAVILCCDVTTIGADVSAWLVVATIAIPGKDIDTERGWE